MALKKQLFNKMSQNVLKLAHINEQKQKEINPKQLNKLFPLYKRGDYVTVYSRLHGTISGTLYSVKSHSIFVNGREIDKDDIPQERFFSHVNTQARNKYKLETTAKYQREIQLQKSKIKKIQEKYQLDVVIIEQKIERAKKCIELLEKSKCTALNSLKSNRDYANNTKQWYIRPIDYKKIIREILFGEEVQVEDNGENSRISDGQEYHRPSNSVLDDTTTEIKTILLPNNIKLEMVRIPAGTFMMGSPSGEFRRFSSRENLHKVTITRDFWMSRFEVTQQQYVSIMGNNPSKFRGDRLPVEQVSWINAETFCRKMNELCRKDIPVGYQFALPTEAEWEYACRATTTTCLNNGKNIYSDQGSNEIDEVAWYSRNSNMQTNEVGLKKPNLWGLYDMHGNVSEWCCEWSERYMGNQVDPITKNSQYKSLRGGAYFNKPRHIRQAFRHPVSGSQDLFSTEPCKSGNNGIRLVLVPLRGVVKI